MGMTRLAKSLAVAAGFLLVAGGAALAANTVLGIFPKSLNGSGGGGSVITCKEGKRFLQSKGYSVTQVVDCRPRFLLYTAMKQGIIYTVTVDGRYPRIADVNRDH
jgi:hypothetical protein